MAPKKPTGEEDRISRLPDDLIHLILSFMGDTKFAVQTCLLSTRWKNLWTSLPHLNFDSCKFGQSKFIKFINCILSRRNHASHISTIKYRSYHDIPPPLFMRILGYAFSKGVQHLNITELDDDIFNGPCLIPISTFSSQSLKHLELRFAYKTVIHIPTLTSKFYLPNLTCLYLHGVRLEFSCNGTEKGIKSADPFSNLMNLKSLDLTDCVIQGLDTLNINSLTLERLNINSCHGGLTGQLVVLTPNLTSVGYTGNCFRLPLLLATEPLSCLIEATIDVSYSSWLDYRNSAKRMHEMLSLVRNAIFLTISSETVVLFSGAPKLLNSRAFPLGNLKCLTIELRNRLGDISNDVITYFLNSSPNASIVIREQERRISMDFSQTECHCSDGAVNW